MAEIDNYEDSSAQAIDDVEFSEENTDSGDESSNRDSRDTRDEDDDPLSLPTCARVISEFALITGLNCSAYPRDAKMKKVLQKDYFKSYPWGEECFDLTTKYLKKKINLKKQSEVYKERGNASYALYGFPWAFLVWIYEVFPHLSNYAKKSLDSPLPIPRLLRWHTAKSANIVEGDPFKYKGRSTKQQLIKMKTYTTPTVDEDGAEVDVDEILPLAIVDENLVAVDEYFAEEVNEQEEEKMEEKDKEREEEKLEENEEGIEEKLENKK
ncbi:hypothetical protein KY284_026211 [Solanum tuberosum]|nr:hypothetical protein KY284_026211 [Solanum tuberosum]